jgi:hypothetical protein
MAAETRGEPAGLAARNCAFAANQNRNCPDPRYEPPAERNRPQKVPPAADKAPATGVACISTNKTFELDVKLSEKERDSLERASTLRNTVVHDQRSFLIEIGDDGVPALRQRSCFKHPAPVGPEEYEAAILTYKVVCGRMYSAVITKVLKMDSHPILESIPKALRLKHAEETLATLDRSRIASTSAHDGDKSGPDDN